MSWKVDVTVVAGADLSGQQGKFVKYGGTLCGSDGDSIMGVLQNKPLTNEHATVTRRGNSRVYAAVSLGAGCWIGPSNTTSGGAAIVTSGGTAFGQALTNGQSGALFIADLFGQPTYIGK